MGPQLTHSKGWRLKSSENLLFASIARPGYFLSTSPPSVTSFIPRGLFWFGFFNYLFILGCTGSSLLCWDSSLWWWAGLSLGVFSCWGHRLQGTLASVVVVHVGLVAPQHVESSRTRDQTHVPYTGRWILIHCTTREVPRVFKYHPHCSNVYGPRDYHTK